MAPSRDEVDVPGAHPSNSGFDQQRNSIASRSSSYAPSLSDIQVADGFRPNRGPFDSDSSSSTITSQEGPEAFGFSHTEAPSDHQSDIRNRPSSVAKPHRPHESLTLRHEHDNSASNVQPSFARASIASSEGPVIRPDSPYRGPTGPSHPYQMYPQRTLSDATTSTATPVSRESPADSEQSQQGPTHPYSLYTQSTTEVEDAPSRSIPVVGFPTLPDNYRRRLGPDGEEAGDLIGPMGHTEELPPYTRYPEIAYVRKESGNDTASTSTPSSSTPGVPALASGAGAVSTAVPGAVAGAGGISRATQDSEFPTPGVPAFSAGAGGLGRATRDPEFSSTEEDLVMDRSRASIRSQTSQGSSHDINTAACEVTDEKPSRKAKWQRRAKKKLWGIIPYWAICLVMVGMISMGVIMGAVLATVLKKSDDKTRKAIAESENEAPPRVPVGEVQPYTFMPDDLDPVTIGTFALPPLDKDEAPRKCFNNSLEFNAWSCDIPFRFYSIDISPIKNASKLASYDLELMAFNETDAQLIWGTQPPSVPEPITLKLVNDTFDMGRGPAWWLSVKYNKTVIVPEANFPLPERRTKREIDWSNNAPTNLNPTRLKKSSKGAEEGDKPWICTWPDTTLEIFIYPNVNASLSLLEEVGTETEPDYAQPTPAYNSEYTNPRGDPTQAYPKAVKFLERRLSGDPDSTAVCRQVEVISGGYDWKDSYDEDGKPIRVEIVETASAWEEQMVANQKREVVREWYGETGMDNNLVRREAQELTSCGCLWWST